MSLTNDLNCRVMLYARQQVTTALGDIDFDYIPQGQVWANIVPTGGSVATQPGDMTQAQLKHTITIRANALPNVQEDMFVVHKNRRYNVDTWRPHYKRPDRVELLCTMEVQPYV